MRAVFSGHEHFYERITPQKGIHYFISGAAGQLNYYLAGFILGMGKKHRAAEQDIWRQQQGQANLGICDCEWMQKRNEAAIPYCQNLR